MPDPGIAHTAPVALRNIVALGGGGFGGAGDDPLLDDFVLGLTGVERPAVCFIPTASGDADSYIVRFHASFPPERARASHLPLFARDGHDVRATPARSGRRLRRRREHRQPARDLARAWDRHDPARGLGGRRGDGRDVGRGAVLVRRRDHRLVRQRRRAPRRPRPAPGEHVPALRQRAGPAAGLPPARRGGRASAGHRRRRQLRAPLPGHRARGGGRVARRARAPTGSTRPASRRSPPAGSADEARGGPGGGRRLPGRGRTSLAPHLPEPRTWGQIAGLALDLVPARRARDGGAPARSRSAPPTDARRGGRSGAPPRPGS